MKIAVIAARTILGLGFVIFGLNILHSFLPMPPMPTDTPVAHWLAVMGPSHWMTLIGLVQLIGGLMVLGGGTTPLGLVFLGPVLVNILAFHLFLDNGNGIVPGLVFSALEVFLLYAYRPYFLPLFTSRASPTRKKLA